jgi:hypothetical protein
MIVSRSLTNPFYPDPEMRSDATCHVGLKREMATKMMMQVSRSLSHVNMQDPPFPSNACIKRRLIAKKTKKNDAKKRATFNPLSDLEYFDYYRNTPPTPLKSKKGQLLYEIDEVLGKIHCDCGKVKFLVKWKGFPKSQNSCISKLPKDFQDVDWA